MTRQIELTDAEIETLMCSVSNYISLAEHNRMYGEAHYLHSGYIKYWELERDGARDLLKRLADLQ